MIKTCIKCHLPFDVNYRASRCSKCNYQVRKTYQSDYRKKNPRSMARKWSCARQAASRRGITWSIDRKEFIRLNDRNCFYCDNQLDKPFNSAGSGIDRIDNDLGYITGNVLPCCKICNSIRGEYLTIIQTQIAVQAIVDHERKLK